MEKMLKKKRGKSRYSQAKAERGGKDKRKKAEGEKLF